MHGLYVKLLSLVNKNKRKITSRNKILYLSRLNCDCYLMMSHVGYCLFNFMQILRGSPELLIVVEEKIE